MPYSLSAWQHQLAWYTDVISFFQEVNILFANGTMAELCSAETKQTSYVYFRLCLFNYSQLHDCKCH